MLRLAVLLALLPIALQPGPGDARPEGPSCGECRVTFMKCLVAGKTLPTDERKAHNLRCAEAAAECYKGCGGD